MYFTAINTHTAVYLQYNVNKTEYALHRNSMWYRFTGLTGIQVIQVYN